jgi:SAM-dependent methyltransferase
VARGPVYDRAYFDRWYRAPASRVFTPTEVDRRVGFAVASAEYLIEQPLRSVLDVCCGEGDWQPRIARLRPRARYVGVDGSAYAVRRFGRRRNLRLGRFGELGRLGLRGPFDLIVCSGALYYIPEKELAPGLRAIAGLLGGAAFLEVFTGRDDLVGDTLPIQARSRSWWMRRMGDAGLHYAGLHFWVGESRVGDLLEFERVRP